MKRSIWLALMIAGAAWAQPQQQEQGQGGNRRGPPHGPPPQEALAACQGQSSGASCSFTHQQHSISGTCRNGPRGEALACVPAGMPPPGDRQGPDNQQ